MKRLHKNCHFIFYFVLFQAAAVFSQQAGSIQIRFKDNGRTAEMTSLRKNNVVYIPIEALADHIGIHHFQNPKNKKIVLRVGSKALKLTALNPFIVVDKDVYQMPLPTLLVEDKIYVPLAIFLEVVGDQFSAKLTFHPESEILEIQQFFYNITGVDVESRQNGYIIRFVTTKDFEITDISTSVNRGWLYVTFMGGSLDTLKIASQQKMGIVNRIVPFQFESSAQISLLLDQSVSDRNTFINPGEVLVSLRTKAQADPVALEKPQFDKKQWLIDRIIIDPGHGGKHPGAVGASGTKEKEITLDIAQRLKILLEQNLDVEVFMTRENDSFVGLKDRTQFANQHQGKLFISIHANGNKSQKVRGFSTWFLGEGKTEQALEVAEKENSVIQFEESAEAYKEYMDAAHILNSIAQSAYLKESQDLATMVNESIKKHTNLPQWGKGVYQAGFYVLIGAAMPSILVETAFLTNTYEEKLLRTRTFRQKIAEALFYSIKQFKEKTEKGIG